MSDLDDIKKLPPEERMKRLKEIQEEKKKELENAEKLIDQEKEEMVRQEKIREELMRVHLPENDKPVDNLEQVIEQEKIDNNRPEILEAMQAEYNLSREPVNELYNRLVEIQENVVQTGYMSQEQQSELNAIGYGLDYKQRDVNSGEYKSASQAIEEKIGTAKSIIKYLRGS